MFKVRIYYYRNHIIIIRDNENVVISDSDNSGNFIITSSLHIQKKSNIAITEEALNVLKHFSKQISLNSYSYDLYFYTKNISWKGMDKITKIPIIDSNLILNSNYYTIIDENVPDTITEDIDQNLPPFTRCGSYDMFLDDERKIPKGLRWVQCRDFNSFKYTIMESGLPGILSLDHDLGSYADGTLKKDGNDCVNWLIKEKYDLRKIKIIYHSSNYPGRKNMESKILSWIKVINS